jgi:dimethylhistidine N-methyltransferase
MTTLLPQPELIDLHPAPADMARLVKEGLQRQPRQLPAWFLYDEEGSRLFDAICRQPEYTLTVTETALLEVWAPAIARAMGSGVLVEFGAGSARKVSPLLNALAHPAYVALDISSTHLNQACRDLVQRHPGVPVLGICCDYTSLQHLPDHPLLRDRPRLGFFPGSSLGNFTGPEAVGLLEQFARLLGPGGQLLIGIDQPKSVQRLEAAYNDRAGLSAAFALNLLHRLNRDLGGSFDPASFRYRASWQSEHQRIEMALISDHDQWVNVAGCRWHFEADEPLITEHSVKYTADAFLALASKAGWAPRHRWSDPAGDLGVHLLEQADSETTEARIHGQG